MDTNGSIVRIAKMYEVDHDFALAVIRSGKDGYATLLARSDGSVLAWDGTYNDEGVTSAVKPVLDYEFDTWDDSLWKLVAYANAQLLGPGAALHTLLAPTYSPAAAALDLLQTWGAKTSMEGRNLEVANGVVLAYVPVTEGSAIAAHLQRRR